MDWCHAFNDWPYLIPITLMDNRKSNYHNHSLQRIIYIGFFWSMKMIPATPIQRKLILHIHDEEEKTMKKLNSAPPQQLHILFHNDAPFPPLCPSSLFNITQRLKGVSSALFICATEHFISKFSLLSPVFSSAHFAHLSIQLFVHKQDFGMSQLDIMSSDQAVFHVCCSYSCKKFQLP